MLTVFQGETGGELAFNLDTEQLTVAVSGYLDVVTPHRIMYRFDGYLLSGALQVPKSGLGQLEPAEGYVLLPQVIDISNNVYFLDPQDLAIIEVPGFFTNAVLTSGNSILVRLENLESISAGYATYLAGANGVQTSKFVAFDGTTVHHADCRDLLDAGMIVGISIESASAGDPVRVQSIGLHTSPLMPFSVINSVMLGYNGDVVHTMPPDAVFVVFLGVTQSPQKIQLFIDSLTHVL